MNHRDNIYWNTPASVPRVWANPPEEDPRMPTARRLAHEFLHRRGLTTIFGNPGSNELPFLAGLPDDFRYVLGLHEGAVVGMADGYAQATGRPVLVNLHAAAGIGQRDGRADQRRLLALAPGAHRRPAGALGDRHGGDARQRRRHAADAAPRRLVRRAELRRRRPRARSRRPCSKPTAPAGRATCRCPTTTGPSSWTRTPPCTLDRKSTKDSPRARAQLDDLVAQVAARAQPRAGPRR